MPVFLISIDVTVLSISLPGISQDLHPSANELLWIVDSYSFVLACLLILMGKFGDSFGRLRLLIWGSVIFGAASVMSGFSTSAIMLIIGRTLQGFGGATLMPSTLGMIRHIFQKRSERRLALALWSAAFSSGSAIGPLLGGILIEVANWRYVFFINVPIVIAFVVLAKLFVPESDREESGRIDLLSPVVLIASIFALVLSFKLIIEDFSLWQVGLLVVGAFGLALFWRRQYRVKNPILDVDVVSEPTFRSATLINGIAYFITIGTLFFFPQYLMVVSGLSPIEAGLWALPMVVATVLGALISPIFARKFRSNQLVALGLLTCGLGCLTVPLLVTMHFEPFFYFLCTFLIGLGIGFAEPLTNDTILSSAPDKEAGSVSAISETAYDHGRA
ncbi:MFS transporter, partial [Dermabacter vaginalis]|uniref:MFS transporter n=1 Tax=Dermabacter vaginalis TaxID=1630135 RepID=UPI001EF6C825